MWWGERPCAVERGRIGRRKPKNGKKTLKPERPMPSEKGQLLDSKKGGGGVAMGSRTSHCAGQPFEKSSRGSRREGFLLGKPGLGAQGRLATSQVCRVESKRRTTCQIEKRT